MKRKSMKTTALVLSASLLLGIGATVAYAQNTDSQEKVEEKAQVTATTGTTGIPSKDETVYVLSGADGSAKQVIVSNWLQNTNKADILEDVANLSNIENVKGDEAFTKGDNGALTWNANGADIYYQGTTDQQVPVEMKISYTLDGKSISPEDLAGKSGRVTIRFDYHNHQMETANVGGTQQKLYVPFVVLTGTVLDTDIFRNVTVTNGEMENLGNEIAVMGVALPGMQENLNIGKDKVDIPSYVEIAADVESFDMGPTLTVATTAPFTKLDSGHLDAADLKAQAEKLTNGMTQLMDGSNQLYDGLNTLLEQSGTLVAGIEQLANGSMQLQNGAAALKDGTARLQDGASQLVNGLSTLDANSAALTGGAQQVFVSLLSSANTQLAAAGLDVPTLTIENYAEVLNKVIASLDETAVYQSALKQVTDGVNARRGEIEAAVTAAVQQQVAAEVTTQVTAAVRQQVQQTVQANETQFRVAVVRKATGMSLEEYEAAVAANKVTAEQQAAVNAAVENAMAAEVEKQMSSDDVNAKITAISEKTTTEKMASAEIKALIAKNTELQVEKAISDMMTSPEVQGKLQAAAEGAKSLIALKASLDSYNSFYLGILSYTSGVSMAANGAKDLLAGTDALTAGMSDLSTGVDTLNSGIQTMKGKTPTLLDGITALRDGSGALKDGLKKMMDEGIQKIVDLAENDLEALADRLSASIDVAKGYTSFSGASQDTDGIVKFIYKTDSISVEE